MIDLILILIVAAALAALIAYRCITLRMTFALYVQHALREAAEVVAPVTGYLAALWRFIGPRLTHKQTVAMVLGNVAILIGVDVANMDQLTMALWVAANLMFPPWDDLPNETLDGPRPAPSIHLHGAVEFKAN